VSLREQLQVVYDTNGRLTPALVVAAARPKNSPLHDQFSWDVKGNSEKWLLHQASELIRSVKINYVRRDETQGTVRAFVSTQDVKGHSYHPAEKVAQDPMSRRMALQMMEREWRSLKGRYEQYIEFFEMVRGDLEATG
jgi:hypothetical protein